MTIIETTSVLDGGHHFTVEAFSTKMRDSRLKVNGYEVPEEIASLCMDVRSGTIDMGKVFDQMEYIRFRHHLKLMLTRHEHPFHLSSTRYSKRPLCVNLSLTYPTMKEKNHG